MTSSPGTSTPRTPEAGTPTDPAEDGTREVTQTLENIDDLVGVGAGTESRFGHRGSEANDAGDPSSMAPLRPYASGRRNQGDDTGQDGVSANVVAPQGEDVEMTDVEEDEESSGTEEDTEEEENREWEQHREQEEHDAHHAGGHGTHAGKKKDEDTTHSEGAIVDSPAGGRN